MGRPQLLYSELADEIAKLRESPEVQIALHERALLEEKRKELDQLRQLFDRGRELIEEGYDIEIMNW